MSKPFPLTIWQQSALSCLSRAIERDKEKGGGGYRQTTDVAIWVSITTDQARRVLWSLADAGLVDVFDTTPLDWKITDLGRFALAQAEAK